MRCTGMIVIALVGCSGPAAREAGPDPVVDPDPAAAAAASLPGAGAGDAPSPARDPITPEELEHVRELLREYSREIKSSVVRFDRPSVLARLREARPVRELSALYRAGDPAVRELGGVFWGIVTDELDATAAFLPTILEDLEHRDPRRRAFAAEALGYVGQRQYVPHLRAHRDDDEPVPGYSEGTVVADFVRAALERLDAPGR